MCVCVVVWGYVGYGHSTNLEPDPVSAAGKRIIVSRSHAGEVEAVARVAFGADTTVIPAGGSGTVYWTSACAPILRCN